MVDIRLARLEDTEPLMAFMHEHWRANHILSRNRELFLHDFQEGERLNLAIATDPADEIVGLFGFMKYNHQATPDIAGSLWKALDSANEPMLGMQLREYVIDTIPHRVFAAPGAGPQTRPIYHFLQMDWIEMAHYYRFNSTLSEYRLAKVPDGPQTPAEPQVEAGFTVEAVTDADALRDFPFLDYSSLAPLKDWHYLRKRFFAHPVYRYRVYLASRYGQPLSIAVCRIAGHEGATACRVVDFYGDEAGLPAISATLNDAMVQEGHEYIDFICCGFDPAVLANAGFNRLDMNDDRVIIPNYFEPFVQKNVPVYAVADRTARTRVRLCKADGDQDRPNA